MLFRSSPVFIAAILAGFVYNFGTAVSFLQVTNLWQYVNGLSTAKVAMWQLPLVAAGIVAALGVGKLMTSKGLTNRLVLLVGVGAQTPADLRRAGATLARAVRDRGAVATTLAAVPDDAGLAAFVAGAVLGSNIAARNARPEGAIVGGVLGGIYGLITEYRPEAASGFGGAYGVVTSALLDEGAVPALGLGSGPTETPASIHAYGAASHLVYGMVLEGVRRIIAGSR